jgi:DNA-binding CsgD family transcriptional regulator
MSQLTATPWSSDARSHDWGDWFEPADRTLPLTELWEQLCARRARCVATFFTERDCCIVLELAAPAQPFGRPIGPRELRILERALFGHHQKAIAIELDRASSTISEALRKILSGFGFDCGGAKLPLMVLLAAHAARVGSPQRARVKLVELDGRSRQVVFVSRPDRDLDAGLSGAEMQVARLLVEGFSYAEIAERRGTSSRTVANQLAALFRKLDVSGRTQFLRRLVERAAQRAAAGGDESSNSR